MIVFFLSPARIAERMACAYVSTAAVSSNHLPVVRGGHGPYATTHMHSQFHFIVYFCNVNLINDTYTEHTQPHLILEAYP